jgi:ABC-2 type transport system ATP-binding protein
MSVQEYLLVIARLYRLPARPARLRIDDVLDRFGLASRRRTRLGSLSKGMRQKIALIRAIIHAPPVLLLDEPTSALDPLSAQAVHEFIAERRAAGDAIVISTHNLPEAEALADRVAIIAGGRLRRQGTLPELCRASDGLEAFAATLATTPEPRLWPILTDVVGLGAAELSKDSADRPLLTYRTATPDRTNAALAATLASNGVSLVEMSRRPRRLQDVYLDTIREASCHPLS